MLSHQLLQLLTSELFAHRVSASDLQALSQTCRALRAATATAVEAAITASIPPLHPLRANCAAKGTQQVLQDFVTLTQCLSHPPLVQCAQDHASFLVACRRLKQCLCAGLFHAGQNWPVRSAQMAQPWPWSGGSAVSYAARCPLS